MGSSARGRQAEANALVPLPLRDGVAPSYLWLTATRAGGVLRCLCERFPDVPMQSWAARLERGEVVDAKGARVAFVRNRPVGLDGDLDAELMALVAG